MIENCPKCETKLLNAPGIGPYCPNEYCDVVDNILNFGNPPIFSFPTVFSTDVVEVNGSRYVKIPDALDWKVGNKVEWDYVVYNNVIVRKIQ